MAKAEWHLGPQTLVVEWLEISFQTLLRCFKWRGLIYHDLPKWGSPMTQRDKDTRILYIYIYSAYIYIYVYIYTLYYLYICHMCVCHYVLL